MIIYKITNQLNGDFYIGMTTRTDVMRRWYEHKWTALNTDSNYYFPQAIRHYGVDSFVVEIIESGIESRELLADRECFYISHLKPAYNVSTGGIGFDAYERTDSHKKQLSELRKGTRWYHCPSTQKQGMYKECPDGWIIGRINSGNSGGHRGIYNKERADKVAAQLRGKPRPQCGRVWTEKERSEQSDRMKRQFNNGRKGMSGTTGMKMSEETKAKMSAARLGKKYNKSKS